MNVLPENDALAMHNLSSVFQDLQNALQRAVRHNLPTHEIEKALWEQLLRLGRAAMTQIFALLGSGHRGETVELPDGRCCQRLEQEHARRYVSIFGVFMLSRMVYPIATGAVEGACRHLVKERMERAGTHWTLAGAQAMLDVRSIHVSGLWEGYQQYRIEREVERLYPHRRLVEENFAVAA